MDERATGLNHLQVVSGMQLNAYWIVQFIFDYAKIEILIGAAIISFTVLPGYDWYQFWPVALVWPFGALPFTYVLSKAFSNSGTAQLVMMGLMFYSMMI